MKKYIVLLICVLFFKLSYSIGPEESNNSLLIIKDHNIKVNLNKNYQQFKYQVINFETTNNTDFSYLQRRRRKKNDNLMLYVAGGIAVATATLILTNDPENFTSNSAASVNTGIAIGGTVACGMFLAKYFIDKGR